MKKIYSLLFLVVASVSFGQTIYTENMGTPSANTLIPAYATGTAPATFQNGSPIVYTGTGDVRTSLPSTTTAYSTASGSGNVFLNGVGKFLQIDGINTSAYSTSNLRLSFGVNTATTVTNVLTVEVSTNGTSWTPLTYTPSATNWTLATITSGIPSSTTLSIRFTTTSAAQFRLDDISVFNFNAACTLALGTPTTVCNDVTQGIDTYTTSISYTGGGSGSYTITASAGTVAGDNPGSVAAGTIVINGVAEGTNLTVNVTSGVCSYQATVTAPECKPVNPLPYYEPFAYAEASSLGQSQQWSNVNTGDNIIVAGGNLLPAYPGLAPTTTGYAIFAADGIDCSTSITPTNSGTIYYSFIVNVNSMTGVTNANGGYFAAFGSSSSNLGATLWTKRGADDAFFTLGVEVRTDTGANTTFTTTEYSTTSTYFVVVGYTFGTGTSDDSVSLWVNPTIGAAQPAATLTDTHAGTDLATISNFLLRQDSTNETPSMSVDELRIGTTWAQVTSGTLGTTQNTIAGLKVHPNPVSNGTLFIETAANAEKAVIVYDVLGKQVLNTKTTNNSINVGGLKAGVYIVNITEEGKTASTKLVIK